MPVRERLLTTATLLATGHRRLAGVATARLDAELLLAYAIGRDRSWLLARRRDPLPAASRRAYAALIEQRRRGVPVAYLTGRREFYGRDLAVTPAVLVPRPETELLVTEALAAIEPGDTVVDIGTGSGCIGISIAAECPDITVIATDNSTAALAVARRNSANHGIANISFVLADLLPESLPDPDHCIVVGNLPYLPATDRTDYPNLRHEPPAALWAGPDGLAVIRRLFTKLQHRRWQPRRLFLEIDPRQRSAVSRLAYGPCSFSRDLAGRYRVSRIIPNHRTTHP